MISRSDVFDPNLENDSKVRLRFRYPTSYFGFLDPSLFQKDKNHS